MPSIIPLRYRQYLQDPRIQLGLLLVVLLALILFLSWAWQPENAVRSRWSQTVKALEDRRYGKLEGLIAQDYEDAWGQDRETAISNVREALRSFYDIEITENRLGIERQGEEFIIRARLKLDGQDLSGLGSYVMAEANTLTEPWVITFRKDGGWPWQWRIRHIEHPQLEVDRYH